MLTCTLYNVLGEKKTWLQENVSFMVSDCNNKLYFIELHILNEANTGCDIGVKVGSSVSLQRIWTDMVNVILFARAESRSKEMFTIVCFNKGPNNCPNATIRV